MSLVNDMLRDLNRRTPVSNKAARVHGTINSSIENKRPKARLGLFVAGALLAGLGIGYVYFESMGVQVVQVPLAVVPPQAPSSAPVPASEAAVNSPDASANRTADSGEAATAELPAVENVVEIRELAMQPNGFTLLIAATEATSFEVVDRGDTGLTLHIDGIDRFDRAGTTVPGMSLLLVSDGLDLGLELDAPADFLVREDTETPAFDILITASYRPREELSAAESEGPSELIAASSSPPPAAASTSAVTSSTPSAPATGERSGAVRVNRELSLEDRDRNNSQEALMLVQGGRMVDAYRQLLDFLEQNPAAHQSRETLAKLLLAQQEYGQAAAVVNEGLAQLPNFAPFKKVKARLLMQDGNSAEALALLRDVPPAAADDTEYYELLASLYRAANQHQQAIATYQELLRIDRTQGSWWTGLAISLEALDMKGDARASYQAALQATNLDGNLRQFIQTRINNLGNQQ